MAEKTFNTSSPSATSAIFGTFDINVTAIERAFNVKIVNRPSNNDIGDCVTVSGDEENVKNAYEVLIYLNKMASMNNIITEQSVDYAISMVTEKRTSDLNELDDDCFFVSAKGRPIKAKTVGQKRYIDSIKKNTVTVGIGPAGTGKTYLAVALAVAAYKSKEIEKIILTRPAVEAGEKLGFLPGDLQNKVDPYLRPLYDALQEMFGLETYLKLMERGVIEIAPLAYMRGRTLNNSFIILDEAQNTTKEQMKMFLTRLGENSKAVITGDVTQVDLPDGKKSGLKHASEILKGIDGISIINLTHKDVVRHPLVMKIIEAYESKDK